MSEFDKIIKDITKVPSKVDFAEKSQTGLPNCGNTCYLNSILQILLHTPELIQFFLNPKALEVLKSHREYEKAVLAAKFYDLFIAYWSGNSAAIRKHLIYFKKVLAQHFQEFQGSTQNDQMECLVFLLDAFHIGFSILRDYNISKHRDNNELDLLEHKALLNLTTEGLSYHPSPTPPGKICLSPITDCFLGQRHYRTECDKCGYISHRFEAFKLFETQIPLKKSESELTIYDCLDHTTGITQLAKTEQYTCDRCKKKNQSRRRVSIWRSPQYLIIGLIRNLSKIHDGEFHHMKDPRQVIYPKKLDITKYMSNKLNNPHYELHSVACHFGMPSFGHCTAYIQLQHDKQWYNFDDNKVGQVDQNFIQGPEGYILVYRQIS